MKDQSTQHNNNTKIQSCGCSSSIREELGRGPILFCRPEKKNGKENNQKGEGKKKINDVGERDERVRRKRTRRKGEEEQQAQDSERMAKDGGTICQAVVEASSRIRRQRLRWKRVEDLNLIALWVLIENKLVAIIFILFFSVSFPSFFFNS